MNELKVKKRNPWLFVPSQYFAEGIPWVIVNQLSVAMFKSLNASNLFIGMTSFLYIPWAIKFLWGPYVDSRSTKRQWVIVMQLVLGVCFAAIALGLHLPSFIVTTLIILTIIAFLSATHDIATDGFYLHALEKGNQAFFSGIRSTFYRIAMIFAGGLLIVIAGAVGTQVKSTTAGWSIAFTIAAIVFFLAFLYHKFILPYPASDKPVRSAELGKPFKMVFQEYFTQKKIGVILLYILTYRLGEGLLVKMAQPFFLDKYEVGGLNLNLSEVGIMYGTLGILALLLGGILGGLLVKKYGLKKLIFPMALFMNLPNLLYVYMALVPSRLVWNLDLSWIAGAGISYSFHPVLQACVVIEQFGYGLGFTAFMVYLLYTSKGDFKTSHYAISTGIMAIGMMIPGFLSGVVQQWLGYAGLFITSFIATIPGMIVIFFLPFDFEENMDESSALTN